MEDTEVCPVFTMKKLEEAILFMKNKQMPVEVHTLLFHHRSELMLETYNAYMKGGVFTCRWKMASLLLITKGIETLNYQLYTGYRLPANAWHTQKEALKKLVWTKLAEAIRACGGLSPKYFDFEAERSTVDAVIEVAFDVKLCTFF